MTEPSFFEMRTAGGNQISEMMGSDFDRLGLGLAFAMGKRFRAGEVKEPILLTSDIKGPIPDICFVGAFVPILRHHAAQVVVAMAGDDVQEYRCQIETESEEFSLINLTHVTDGLDEQRSIFGRTVPGEPASHFGRYKNIAKLVLDPQRVGPHHMFRVEGMNFAGVVVSAKVATALKALSVTGVTFYPAG